MGNRSDEISKVVTTAILDKRLLPGSKLGEQVLADIFGVSRAVVRQALIRLADDGLVSMVRNRGAFVSKPSFREAMEIYDALTILEQGVAAQLSGRLNPGEWDELRQHVAKQRRAVGEKNDVLADELGQSFHTLFVRLSRNLVVQELHAQLTRRTALLRSLIRSRFDYCGLLQDHGKLIDLLQEGRTGEARDLIDLHHRNVVKGYVLEDAAAPESDVRDALAPYATKSIAA